MGAALLRSWKLWGHTRIIMGMTITVMPTRTMRG